MGSVFSSSKNDLKGVETDWQKYLGQWYEQARIPSFFENEWDKDSMAQYRWDPENKTIEVTNSKINALGLKEYAYATARIASYEKGLLFVSFVPSIEGKYIVIDHDTNYEWSIVAGSGRDYLWLLTRSSGLSMDVWNHLMKVAKKHGFDLSKIQKTPKSEETEKRESGSLDVNVPGFRMNLPGGCEKAGSLDVNVPGFRMNLPGGGKRMGGSATKETATPKIIHHLF